MKTKRAFTLAEVLITLGIIGVVASMTLPTVINKTQEKQYKVAYKKAYSSLSQAFLLMQAAGEFKDMSQTTDDSAGVAHSPAIGENFKIISKYFKATKTCFDKNPEGCWELKNGEQACMSAAANNWVGCSDRSSYAFVDGSGMSWYLYSNNEWPVLVDVNGKKKPNKLGKDRFVLRFAAKQSNDIYIEDADLIMPWEDRIEKGRWCPSGNCLYKTWLLE